MTHDQHCSQQQQQQSSHADAVGESGSGTAASPSMCEDDECAALQSAVREASSRSLTQSVLSDAAILHHVVTSGLIVISPFRLSHLSTSSYDVTLGPHYYRETRPEPGCGLYNPYCRQQVQRVWGEPLSAESHAGWLRRTAQQPLVNIAPSDLLIWIAPGETILAHSVEFIGGLRSITTMMKARSSMGRNFIEVCKCAGWGDVGYSNRWTMEITNNSRYYSIPLVVGRRIAQIVFIDVGAVLQGEGGKGSYEKGGKYQTATSQEELMRAWTPAAMLPKMYLDRECRQSALDSRTAADDGDSSQQPQTTQQQQQSA